PDRRDRSEVGARHRRLQEDEAPRPGGPEGEDAGRDPGDGGHGLPGARDPRLCPGRPPADPRRADLPPRGEPQSLAPLDGGVRPLGQAGWAGLRVPDRGDRGHGDRPLPGPHLEQPARLGRRLPRFPPTLPASLVSNALTGPEACPKLDPQFRSEHVFLTPRPPRRPVWQRSHRMSHTQSQHRAHLRPSLILIALMALALPAMATAGVKPPQVTLNYEKYTLPNGLEVILHEDHKLPLVAVNTWYHVGPANEIAGRTGFAHLFEHMMFQSSGHVGEDQIWKYLEGAGASFINGTTDFDRTNYMEDMPANQLETAIWLESDR